MMDEAYSKAYQPIDEEQRLPASAATELGGFGIWRGAQWARWLGVTTASLNAITQLLWLPSYPLAALAVFAVDVIVLYALLTHGGSRTAPAVS